MSNDDDPMVSIKMSVYDRLREAGKLAQAEAYKAQELLQAARLTDADGSGMTKNLFDAFHQAMKIVQFAVGNLNPETIAGWPHEALTNVAGYLESIPGIERHLTELPDDLRRFASQAASLENWRRERDKNKIVVMAGAADFGPKTPEAMAVHTARVAAANGAKDTAGLLPCQSPPYVHTFTNDVCACGASES